MAVAIPCLGRYRRGGRDAEPYVPTPLMLLLTSSMLLARQERCSNEGTASCIDPDRKDPRDPPQANEFGSICACCCRHARSVPLAGDGSRCRSRCRTRKALVRFLSRRRQRTKTGECGRSVLRSDSQQTGFQCGEARVLSAGSASEDAEFPAEPKRSRRYCRLYRHVSKIKGPPALIQQQLRGPDRKTRELRPYGSSSVSQ